MLGGDRYKLQSKLVTNKNVFRGVGYADEPVVIKLDNSELKELLRHEAQIYTKLRRVDGVLTMKWYGVQQNYLYLVLPYVKTNLLDVIPQLAKNAKIVENIATQLLQVIEAVHSKDVIHRDVKPDNILIDDRGRVFLIDFGMAKIYRQAGEHMPCTQTHDIIGTEAYISLNVHDKISPSRRDDVIGVGYTLIHTYVGQSLFKDKISKTTFANMIIDDIFLKRVQRLLEKSYKLEFCEIPHYIV